MSKQLDKLRDEVSRLCERTDVPEPGEFLASLMSGTDPRPRSNLLFKYIKNIVDELGPEVPPTPDEWEFIVDIILNSGLYENEPVSLDVSVQSANKLMDFLHAKLKAIELNAEIDINARVVPLSDDEIKRFKEVWDSRF